MDTSRSILRLLLAIFLLLMSAPALLAQAVADHVTVTPRPDWIRPVSVPDYDREADKGRDLVYALSDFQNRYWLNDEAYSTRYVVDLYTPAAVEEQGTISLSFDLAYERIDLHHVTVTRDGERLDAIDMTEAMIFRTETDRDQMIFNGSLTFSMPVLGLRIGDRLDVAYTTYGRNPAIKTGLLSRRIFETTTEIKRRYMRIDVQDGQPIFTRTYNDPPEPDRRQADGWTSLTWDAPDPQAADYDSDAPNWAYRAPTYEVSNFESWSDVGKLFADYYILTNADRAAVSDIVADIAANHAEPKEQARAALDWVQTHIRYVALSYGAGGFVPRRPERVLKRRFGDCKDVTLLLLALLDGLNVDADPILVDMDERGGEFKSLPNPYAFNHIKVLAEIDDTLYPLDATRDPQLGTLDTMERGDIAFGLRMGEPEPAITRLPFNDYDVRQRIRETFDTVSETGAVLYTLSYEEFGGDADGTVSWLASDGAQSVTDSFVDYLDDIYPTMEQTGALEVEIDEEAARSMLTLAMKMNLEDGSDTVSLNSRAWEILSRMPEFEGGKRRSPFEISHPRDVQHIRDYIVPPNTGFADQSRTIENDAFRFTMKDIVEDGQFREDYRYTSKQDFIAAADFEDVMAEVEDIRDWNYSNITIPLSGGVSSSNDRPTEARSGTTGIILGWLFLILFPFAIGLLIWRSRRRDMAHPNAS